MTDTAPPTGPLEDRVAAGDWDALTGELDLYGSALTWPLLTPAECAEIAGLYDEDDRFRTTVDMARHRFGSGQYRYFTHDLPDTVRELREAFYPRLLPVARDWAGRLGRPAPWPETLREWLTMCHDAGQDRSAQILLRYGPGDWNALHRDVFGDKVFPLQVVIGLDAPGTDFTGGEFLMTEQRPRAQTRGSSTTLPQGHGLVFTTRDRPVPSKRGWSNGPMRHGVSTVRSGHRRTLGLVFHDAA
ncbi:2OG-Fe(II) oxygenase [Streptomyces bacillaris]|uniref:2OG-Fe(II) oxygenase n=1 Tax=Streptomyces cavourensis TaxID=67258 RepID=A0AAD0Q6P5_9ACTN|nr:2OG-Fe(II) oxygenase [Streptomyces cavourensis]AXI73233.1 proline hydroxylase [Streptomyces cavourensis]MBH0245839.1 2OG-Fe(II) oxygenase [Streptomyces cavourensis]UTR77541.1 2OG-Fe(II) oxygenase [Streptomyces cavourensis]